MTLATPTTLELPATPPVASSDLLHPIHVISLGAGVQSSTMALMAAHGEITPMPKAAIFADTGNEPQAVYEYLAYLEKLLPFPVVRVADKMTLWEDSVRVITSNGKNKGKKYLKGMIPAYLVEDGKKTGLLGRRCTQTKKIEPIIRAVKKLAGVKRGGKKVIAVQWIGISYDEIIRMKGSRKPYIESIWPLIDKQMTRRDCLNWMQRNGYKTPPRSACYFCPFHGDAEWKNLKENHNADFMLAVKYEKELQAAAARQEVMKGTPWLHPTCKPLDEIDFNTNIKSHAQLEMFANECEGLCGV